MPAKMRLQRRGKKGQPFYHIVIADGRAPRDGRFIEKIGTYNPMTDPATIELNFDKALQWLNNGAQPTDTVRAILSYKGVLLKSHLLKGVTKGALTIEQAEAKFQTWLSEKEAKIEAKKKGLVEKDRNERKKRIEAEVKAKELKEAEVAKKRAAELQAEIDEAKAKAEEAAAAKAEESTEETESDEGAEAGTEEA